MAFITFILPTYKPQSYIYDCINSFASQSSSKDAFELVIVLNGPKELELLTLQQDNYSQTFNN